MNELFLWTDIESIIFEFKPAGALVNFALRDGLLNAFLGEVLIFFNLFLEEIMMDGW